MPDSDREVLCFNCAQPIGDPPRLNEIEEGEVCPVCRDRLLEELPPIVHSPVAPAAAGWEAQATDDELDVPQGRPQPRLVRDEPGEDTPAGREPAEPDSGATE